MYTLTKHVFRKKLMFVHVWREEGGRPVELIGTFSSVNEAEEKTGLKLSSRYRGASQSGNG